MSDRGDPNSQSDANYANSGSNEYGDDVEMIGTSLQSPSSVDYEHYSESE